MGNFGFGRRRRNAGRFSNPNSSGKEGRSGPSRPSAIFEEEWNLWKHAPPKELTDAEKKLIIQTWRVVEDDIARVGIITFISLFETHPDVQQVFAPFKGVKLDELMHSTQLKAHALRVMAFVQKAVARLYEMDKLQQLLHELGTKHVAYGIRSKYIDLIGPQFMSAVQPSLKDMWTAEVEAAWNKLFRYISYTMKNAMKPLEGKK